MNDTAPDIQRKVRELMQKHSGAERVKMASDMFGAARTLVIASCAPGLGIMELKLQLCERFYGTEIDLGAFSAALLSSESLVHRPPQKGGGLDATGGCIEPPP